MKPKPSTCSSCLYDAPGCGFVAGVSGPSPKVYFLFDAPGKMNTLYDKPLWGRTERWFIDELLPSIGYTRDECGFDHLIRCYPLKGYYPTGMVRKAAEKHCRHYDDGLRDFDPNLIGVTYPPSSLCVNQDGKRPDYHRTRLIESTVAKAFRHAEKGDRPLVVMGEKGKDYFTSLPGGLKFWQGHFQPLDWERFV